MITGQIQAISVKPHKTKPGVSSVGLKINNAWYNLMTKYPDNVKQDDTVSFEILEGTESLVDTKTFSVKKDGTVAATTTDPLPTQGVSIDNATTSKIDGFNEKVITRLREHTETLKRLETLVLAVKEDAKMALHQADGARDAGTATGMKLKNLEILVGNICKQLNETGQVSSDLDEDLNEDVRF